LVSAVPQEEPLKIEVVRGTDVLERHETAIVDLCNMSGANDKEIENCVVDYMAGGYDAGIEDDRASIGDDMVDEGENLVSDEAADGLIDDIMSLWMDELPLPPDETTDSWSDELPLPLEKSGIIDQARGHNSDKKPKPWSSRSSQSGTFVRDPTTGKMRNIDP
jgi:hypothetical protein